MFDSIMAAVECGNGDRNRLPLPPGQVRLAEHQAPIEIQMRLQDIRPQAVDLQNIGDLTSCSSYRRKRLPQRFAALALADYFDPCHMTFTLPSFVTSWIQTPRRQQRTLTPAVQIIAKLSE